MSVLIWVKLFAKVNQQTTKVAASKERVTDIKCVFKYLCQHNILVHLTLKAPTATKVVCFSHLQNVQEASMTNSVDPDQTAPIGAV